jgi:hypothetical protein
MIGYIYLIQEREFYNLKQPIYKIGRTINIHNRVRNYPKKSKLITYFNVLNCKNTEKVLIRQFKKRFKFRFDLGHEYFEGELQQMIDFLENFRYYHNALVLFRRVIKRKAKSRKTNMVKYMYKNYKCNKCNKILSSKRRLQTHMNKCTGLDKLQCELCHKKFNHASNKSIHKKNKVCERNGTMIQNINQSFNTNSFNITYNNCKINNFDDEYFKTK